MPAAVFARWFTSMDNALTFAEAVLNDCDTKRVWPLVQCYHIKHSYLVTVRT
jgi:hypothetical protein